jgi:hypothetical protein
MTWVDLPIGKTGLRARPVGVGKKGSWWTSFEELKTITEIPAPAQNFLSRE